MLERRDGKAAKALAKKLLAWCPADNLGVRMLLGDISLMTGDWTAQEIDFVDWVFNSSAVLRERANLMEQHEGLTYERDAVRREPFALRSSYFVNELTDDLSIAMVKEIQIRRVNNTIWTIIHSQMDES